MAISALNTALGGIQTQRNRLDQLAGEIAAGGRPVQADASLQQGAEGFNTLSRDLTAPVVELKETELLYRANAKAFEVASETLGSLLDITA